MELANFHSMCLVTGYFTENSRNENIMSHFFPDLDLKELCISVGLLTINHSIAGDTELEWINDLESLNLKFHFENRVYCPIDKSKLHKEIASRQHNINFNTFSLWRIL